MFKAESYQSIKPANIIIAIVAGIAFSTIWIGIMFKLLRFQGSEFMLNTGLIPLAILLVFALIRYMQTKATLYKNILLRAIIFGAIGFILLMVSDLNIIRYQYRDYPDYIKAFEQYTANPSDPTLKQNLNTEYNKVKSGSEEM